MGSIEGRTLPIDFPNLFKQHKTRLRKQRRNMSLVFCLLIQAHYPWSGRRGSNPRLSPWQGDALPLSHSRIIAFFPDKNYIICNHYQSGR